jgi:hypothetical protein
MLTRTSMFFAAVALGLTATAIACSDDTSTTPGDAGTADATPAGDAASPDAKGDPVNGCAEFVDRTDEAASRELPWDFGIASDPVRCMKVSAGQTVTWKGDMTLHPLGVSRVEREDVKLGDEGADVTFDTPGTYGYVCITHPTMQGAILVE